MIWSPFLKSNIMLNGFCGHAINSYTLFLRIIEFTKITVYVKLAQEYL